MHAIAEEVACVGALGVDLDRFFFPALNQFLSFDIRLI